MKAKIGRGKGQKGLIAYAFDGEKGGADKQGKLIGGTCAGSGKAEIQAEFAALRKIRPHCEKPAWHCSLSLGPPESLTDSQWASLAAKYMDGMGYSDKALYAVVRHHDTDHDHIHIVASRIQLDGSLYLGKQEAKKSLPLTNLLAKEYGLNTLEYDKPEIKGITSREKGLSDRTGEIPIRIQLQALIDDAVKGKPTFEIFISKLEKSGVEVIPAGKTGAAQGISFGLDGINFSGSKLGEKYKWGGLKSRLDFEPIRDQAHIDRLRAKAEKEAEEPKGEISAANDAPLQPAPHQQKHYKRTLELTFEKSGERYAFKSNGRVALIDHGNRITVMSQSDSAIKAALQLGKDKGWNPVNIKGNSNFRRQAWLIGAQTGIETKGYTPNKKDQKELEFLLEQKRTRYGKNNGNARTSGEQHTGSENGGGTRGTDTGNRRDAKSPNAGTRGDIEKDTKRSFPDARGNKEINEQGQGYRNGDRDSTQQDQKPETRSDNPRSPDLAANVGGGIDSSDFERIRMVRDKLRIIGNDSETGRTDSESGTKRRNTSGRYTKDTEAVTTHPEAITETVKETTSLPPVILISEIDDEEEDRKRM